MNIGEIIKELRLEKGITQTALAKEVGVTNEWLCAVENRRKNLSAELAYKVADCLHLTDEEKENFIKLVKNKTRPNSKFILQIANMELRDQLEAKEQMIKELKNLLKEIRGKLHYINTPKNKHNIFDNYFMKKIDEVLK